MKPVMKQEKGETKVIVRDMERDPGMAGGAYHQASGQVDVHSVFSVAPASAKVAADDRAVPLGGAASSSPSFFRAGLLAICAAMSLVAATVGKKSARLSRDGWDRGSSTLAEDRASSDTTIKFSNEYGIPSSITEGIYTWDALVEPYRTTTIELSGADSSEWDWEVSVSGKTDDVSGSDDDEYTAVASWSTTDSSNTTYVFEEAAGTLAHNYLGPSY